MTLPDTPRPEWVTKAQRYILAYLESRDRATASAIGLNKTGPLRLMEERGLVSCNSHGQWSLTKDGRQAMKETSDE